MYVLVQWVCRNVHSEKVSLNDIDFEWDLSESLFKIRCDFGIRIRILPDDAFLQKNYRVRI